MHAPRPWPIRVLGFGASALTIAGAIAQGAAAQSSSALEIWGLRGESLAVLAVVGFIDGIVLAILVERFAARPSPGVSQGAILLALNALSLFTSFFGLLLVGLTAGTVAGVVVVRHGLYLEAASDNGSSLPRETVRSSAATGPYKDTVPPIEAELGKSRWLPCLVFYLLGAGYVVLGLGAWRLNPLAWDLLLAGLGGCCLAVGLGFQFEVGRFFQDRRA